MSAEDHQPCANWDDHDFADVYYGYECKKCHLFYAFGCAPWEEDAADEFPDYEDVED